MLFVGVTHSFLTMPGRVPRILFAAVVGIAVSYGLASAGVHFAANLDHPLGVRGFRHSTANTEVIDFIRTIDVAEPDRRSALIFVSSPEIGLEVRNVRVMANHADFWAIEDIARQKLRGRVPRLYVIVQERLVANGKADAMLRSFSDYPIGQWRRLSLGTFVCFFNDG
jgi:hypothetical protein